MLTPRRSGCRAGNMLFTFVLVVGATAAHAMVASAQTSVHDDDHEHDHLHFSHPLVTESPSPDTKFRFDAEFGSSDEPAGSRALAFRAEGEFGFSDSFSLAVVAPFVRITSPRDARASAFGSVELQAKAAVFAFAQSGVLVGGGASLGLPTGSDVKRIGSGHLYELAPFVDAAVKRGNAEAAGFLTYSTAINRNAGEKASNSLTFDGSLLWRFIPQIELLGEITTSRAIGSVEGSSSETFLAPGVKWRPRAWPKFAIGVDAIRGVGKTTNTNAARMSAFYHF